MERLWTVKEVAELLGRSEKYVYDMALKGLIPAVRISKGTVRFDRQDLTKWIDSRKHNRPGRLVLKRR